MQESQEEFLRKQERKQGYIVIALVLCNIIALIFAVFFFIYGALYVS